MRYQLSVVIAMMVAARGADSQILTRETVHRFQLAHSEISVLNNAPKRTSVWTSTLPVTFSRVEREDDEWRIGANMSVGGSYVFMTGRGTPQPDGSIRLDPEFMIGPVANLGLTPGDSGKLDGSLMVGLTVGFSTFAVLGGYDLLLTRPVIGVGIQIQSLTFTQGFTRIHSIR
jgi:hypothetical protein